MVLFQIVICTVADDHTRGVIKARAEVGVQGMAVVPAPQDEKGFGVRE
jgi:hypothetical protein